MIVPSRSHCTVLLDPISQPPLNVAGAYTLHVAAQEGHWLDLCGIRYLNVRG